MAVAARECSRRLQVTHSGLHVYVVALLSYELVLISSMMFLGVEVILKDTRVIQEKLHSISWVLKLSPLGV